MHFCIIFFVFLGIIYSIFIVCLLITFGKKKERKEKKRKMKGVTVKKREKKQGGGRFIFFAIQSVPFLQKIDDLMY